MGKDPEDEYIVARSTEEALQKAQRKFGKDVEIYQEPDVLDTWFSRYLCVKFAFLCVNLITLAGALLCMSIHLIM